MRPLLESFHDYFEDTNNDSPCKVIWKRISRELTHCTQCIWQHHQAQEIYSVEYELDTVDPLLKVLYVLDEERITEHLKEINAGLLNKEYDPQYHGDEVVSVMFEVCFCLFFYEPNCTLYVINYLFTFKFCIKFSESASCERCALIFKATNLVECIGYSMLTHFKFSR